MASPPMQSTNQSIKHIPKEILGMKLAKPAPGMERTLEWLMKIRLHKYWSLFSNMTYEMMLSINEETVDEILRFLGSQPFPQGTRKKVIRSVEELRSRAERLRTLDLRNIEESCRIVSDVLSTPIPPIPEFDGSFLVDQIRKTMTELVTAGLNIGSGHLLKDLVQEYSNHYAFTAKDREIAVEWEADLNREMVWENFSSWISWNGFFRNPPIIGAGSRSTNERSANETGRLPISLNDEEVDICESNGNVKHSSDLSQKQFRDVFRVDRARTDQPSHTILKVGNIDSRFDFVMDRQGEFFYQELLDKTMAL